MIGRAIYECVKGGCEGGGGSEACSPGNLVIAKLGVIKMVHSGAFFHHISEISYNLFGRFFPRVGLIYLIIGFQLLGNVKKVKKFKKTEGLLSKLFVGRTRVPISRQFPLAPRGRVGVGIGIRCGIGVNRTRLKLGFGGLLFMLVNCALWL